MGVALEKVSLAKAVGRVNVASFTLSQSTIIRTPTRWLQNGIMWLLRRIEEPDYYPDAYDLEAALSLLLFVVAYAFTTLIVVSASVVVWRRCMHPRR
ncbi:hypothetical protein LJ655_26610 [Paraburkholderia sp. MMS20-SJTN17]|uniref:Uncharacterized protein n=1 Tax=Paraburkholderia translucens TaxID=2886945 RepID=A0ABS8KLQ3_9BURK|nr:hypothetical protein [Paraburkholderia sp. MMS20-SJTN17]MCC8405383.1 hypothetical protein [Paraburkholderia sp. MMS20-SJTN17]